MKARAHNNARIETRSEHLTGDMCVRRRTLEARRPGLALAAVDEAVGRGDRFRRTTLPIPSELDGRGDTGRIRRRNLDGGDAVRAIRC
jgi:hypothetical protein